MMTRRIWARLALAVFLTLVAISPSSAQERRKLTLVMPFDTGIAFYPVYLAAEKGFFEEEKLDVKIVVARGSSNAVAQLVTGNADVAFASPPPILAAAAKGAKIKSVYIGWQKNPFRLLVPDASPIKTIAELKGQAIGVTSLTGGGSAITRAMLAADAGLEVNSGYKMIEVGRAATAIVAIQGGTIAAYVAGPSDYVALESRGMKLRDLTTPKYSALFDDAFVFLDPFIEKNPDVVAAFGRAIAKASVWGPANPEATIDLVGRRYPGEIQNRDYARRAMAQATTLYAVPAPGKGKWGFNDPAIWQMTVDILVKEGELKAPMDVKTIHSNEFLDRFNAFDAKAVEADAKQYRSK